MATTPVLQREDVHLVVPASPEYLRLARMTAAGLASRLGFTYDDVEDLRIAVDELCFVLVGTAGRPGSIALTYRIEGRTLTIEGEGRFETGAGAPPGLSELSRQILAAVVDEHDVSLDGTPRFWLQKVAR
jgi:hypothetical protein